MKNMLLLLGLVCFCLRSFAQAPVWQAAIVASQTAGTICTVRATAADASGNIYLTGDLTGQVNFGNTTIQAAKATVFVAKWNARANQFVWALQASGSNNDNSYAIAVSGTTIYVGGSFRSSTITFGSTVLTKSTTLAHLYDIFIAKITDAGSSGSWTWAKRAAGQSQSQVEGLAVSGNSVYAVGEIDSYGADFDNIRLNTAGSLDVFIAKLTDEGSSAHFAWAQRAGGSEYDRVAAVSVRGTSVYAVGYFDSPRATFGSTTLLNPPNGAFDMFVTKLTDTGTASEFTWTVGVTSKDGGEIPAVLVVNQEGIYVAGKFNATSVQFGPYTLTNADPASATKFTYDIFVTKLTDTGATATFNWAQGAGGEAEKMPQA